MPRIGNVKSRYGCKNCKSRKVKCDEHKPACLNCQKRSDDCVYFPNPNTRPITRIKPVQAPRNDFQLTLDGASTPASTQSAHEGTPCVPLQSSAEELSFLDLELMYHYSTSTCHAMSESDDSGAWEREFPTMGMQYKPIMHLILALSALHLRSLKTSLTSSEDMLLLRAEHHFSHAIPHLIGDLARLEDQTQKPLNAAAALIGVYYLARGPAAGQYIAYADHTGHAEGYRLLQGAKQVIMAAAQKEDGYGVARPASPLASRSAPAPLSIGHSKALSDLLQATLSLCTAPEEQQMYTQAIEDLRTSFAARYDAGSYDQKDTLVFRWLYKQPASFIDALERKMPAALLVYGHFAVLVASTDDMWHMRGWATHVLRGVEMHLAAALHRHLAWPKQHVFGAKSGGS